MTRDTSPNYIVGMRKLVHFPTQAEIEQRRLVARNRRRAIVARAALVGMALTPLGGFLGYAPLGVLALGVVSVAVFAAMCLIGAHQNERR